MTCYLTSCWCAPVRWVCTLCKKDVPVKKVEIQETVHRVSRELLIDALDVPRPLPLDNFEWKNMDGKIVNVSPSNNDKKENS